MSKLTCAHVHRFHDKAALSLPGNGETVYFDAQQARKLARALYQAARSIETVSFVNSSFGNVAVSLVKESRK